MTTTLDNDLQTLEALAVKYHHTLRGQSAYYAILQCDWRNSKNIIEAFYKLTSKLSYREAAAFTRSAGVTYSTVQRWRYLQTMPRSLDTILAVIEWGKAGKPLTLKKRDKRLDMF